MELLYLYWICLPLRRLSEGLWLPKLTFSACYGALLMETLWASEVRFTYTKCMNSMLTIASQEFWAFAVRSGGWKAIVSRRGAMLSSNGHAFFSCFKKIGWKLKLSWSQTSTKWRWWRIQSKSLTKWKITRSSPWKIQMKLDETHMTREQNCQNII